MGKVFLFPQTETVDQSFAAKGKRVVQIMENSGKRNRKIAVWLSDFLKTLDLHAFFCGTATMKAQIPLVFDLAEQYKGIILSEVCRTSRPRRLRAKYTPCTNSAIFTRGYFGFEEVYRANKDAA